MLLSHVGVGLSQVLEQDTQKTSAGNQDQGFFVENVDFLGDKCSGQTGTNSQVAGLGGNGVTGKDIQNTGLFLGSSS